MSRVYDALRQWNRERGMPADAFYERPSLQKTQDIDDAEQSPQSEVEKPESLRWSDIAEIVPLARPEDHLVALNNGAELGTEKFRLLQSRIRQIALNRQTKIVLITSAVPEDGKSLVASNLAFSLASHTNSRVLLLEGDLHKPTLARKIGLGGRVGLSECLSNGESLENSCWHIRGTHLWLLPAGQSQERPLSLLQSSAFPSLLVSLSSAFDWVLIDAPPLLPLADAGFWAQQSDGILLVVRKAHTPRELLTRSLEVIDTTKILGVVYNDSQPTEHDYYNRYYHS